MRVNPRAERKSLKKEQEKERGGAVVAGEDVAGRKDKERTKERRLALMHHRSNGMGRGRWG